MDDSRISHENVGDNEFLLLSNDHHHNSLANLMKHSLLIGVDTLLMARKPDLHPTSFDFEAHDDYIEANDTFKCKPTFSSSSNEGEIYYFPLNTIAYMTVLALKLAGFQMSMFISFLTLPIRVFNFGFMFVMFPFQMLTHLRDHMKKKLKRAFHVFYFRLIGFGCNRLRSHKSVLKVAVRFGRAVFCAAYVFFVLVGLLVSGFAFGGFVMRRLVRESMHTTEALNFDYTKTSPVAIVPVASSLDDGILPHKLKLTVSLTLPESEYNRKLGIFQVRVETLSDNGKVILRSSYPTMLRFKSHPVRAFETLFNAVHLMAGLKSEVQHLKIGLGWFINQGYEQAASFKVILEQRAELQGGSGVPEIYGGSLEIESELPKLKRILWDWRRTLFVWIGFGSFMAETMVVLIFFRGVVLPVGHRKSKAMDMSKKKCWPGQITWHKAI